MIHFAIMASLAAMLLVLVRRGLIHVDLSLAWLVAIIALGLLSISEGFVQAVAHALGIVYAPLAIVFIAIFILLGLITVLLHGYTRLRERQIRMLRMWMQRELAEQEVALKGGGEGATKR